MNLAVRPVTMENRADLERLFESRGGPHYCWCMAWRRNQLARTVRGKAGRKAALVGQIEEGIPVGLLGYVAGEPVAWCSVAPKETYRTLGGEPGDNADGPVWSLVCFFVKRPFRGQGLTERLIAAAADHARTAGAQWLEAYPANPDSPSYRFMGVRPTFERAGFAFMGPAGTRRSVMRLRLR